MSLIAQRLLSVVILSGAIASTLSSIPVAAQTTATQQDRVPATADLRVSTRLTGYVPGWASAARDAGSVSPDTLLRLTFVLTRSADRQAAFEQMLASQQTPGSPSYHHWLTPARLGTLYGPTSHDLATLTSWLTAQGFVVTDSSASGIFVTAQAPVSKIASALDISFRQFTLNGPDGKPESQSRIAPTGNPALPAALASIVGSISGLADTPAYPMLTSRIVPMPVGRGSESPSLTASNGVHLLTPNDFALIYDLGPAYKSGINGAGQKIAVLGRSRVVNADITTFETATALPNVLPNVIIPTGGTDPGVTNTTDQDEATLDVDRVIGTAPGAQVDLVVSSTGTASLSALQFAAQYEVNTLLDPIMNISFGTCEANAGLSVATFWDNIFSTGAAEGISSFVASGDNAAAACQSAFQPPTGVQARSINVLCSSSYVTCVGGTEFADFASPATFWSNTNGTGFQSVLSYIPEGAWNEPVGSGSTPFVVAGTGGGVSTFISKPTWQIGIGVPADGFRDIPDISFSASAHDGYLGCLAYTGANCTTNVTVFGGTSAAAPGMAGMAALLNQKKNGSQGNLNPLLYNLAAVFPNAFHDATPATSGVSCDINTPSMCNNSTPSATALTGGLAGYALTTGYDLATGLGSLDASNFLTAAAIAPGINLTAVSSSLTLTAGSTAGNTDALTLTSSNYIGLASLTCAVAYNGTGPASFTPTCSVNPATLTLTSNGSAASTLTISSVLPHLVHPSMSTVAMAPPARKRIRPGFSTTTSLALSSLFLLIIVPSGRRRRTLFALRSWQTLPTVLFLFCGMSFLTACSGSSTPVKGNPLLLSGTTTTIPALASIPSGSSDTFVATVVNSGFNTTVNPTGTVQFFVNGITSLGTATLSASGTATSAVVPFTMAGTFPISASYGGDANFSPSSSSGVPLTVTSTGTSTGSYTVTVTATTPTGFTSIRTIALTIN